MSKRQKFLADLKEAVSKAGRTRSATRSSTRLSTRSATRLASSSSTPQTAALRTVDLNAESPCPAVNDTEYDKFVKGISYPNKHDVGSEISSVCTVSKQKDDFRDKTTFNRCPPSPLDKQSLQHEKGNTCDNHRHPVPNGETAYANCVTFEPFTSTATAKLPMEAPLDTCSNAKSLQPYRRNLFGAEKASCNQGSECEYGSNIDKSSPLTSPAVNQVAVDKSSLLISPAVSQVAVDKSSLLTSPAVSQVALAQTATEISLNNGKSSQSTEQNVTLGKKLSCTQDSGFTDGSESSMVECFLATSPAGTSQRGLSPTSTELWLSYGYNMSSFQAVEQNVPEEGGAITHNNPTGFLEERESDNNFCLPNSSTPIRSDMVIVMDLSDIQQQVEVPAELVVGDVEVPAELVAGNVEVPAELVVGDVIMDTVNIEQSETETPIRKRQFTPPEKATRKRVRAPQRWKKNVNKECFSKGIEYVNPKGKVKRARKLQPGCDLSCRNKCITKILQPAREDIFRNFWSIPSQVEKWGFISRLIKTVPVQRSMLETPQKKHSRQYFLRVQASDIKVCKTMFLDTLDVCDSWVETALGKVEEGGTISPDKRGKHLNKPGPGPKSNEVKQTIRDHIATLQRMPSHYSRANSNREYLTDEFKSVADMYEIYKGWMAEQHPTLSVATLRQYRDVFNFEYNLDFFIPMKDLCDVCVTYQNTPPDQRTPAMESAYQEHSRTKDLLYLMKKVDVERAKQKTSTTLCVVDMDYQKSLNSPKCFTSVFYYRRKLSVNNFTMVDVGRDENCCYVYDETIAKKGSKEVCSFMNHFITRKAESGIKEIIIYCDNCGGQNKNRNVVAFLVYIAAKFNIKVTLKYLEKGHTYNMADTVHSLIERKSRPHQLYSPEQWYEVIASSKRSKTHPMVVERVSQDIIYDWNDLSDKLNLDKNVHGQAIPWTKVREFRFDGSTPHEFLYKLRYEDEPITVSTKNVGRPVNFSTYELKKLYSGPLPISQAKLQDLLYYCDHNYVPLNFQEFYRGLKASSDVPDNVVAVPEVDNPQGRARVRRPVAPKKSQKNAVALASSARPSRRKRVKAAKKTQKASEENSGIDDPDDPGF